MSWHKHVYARKLDGSRVCVGCGAPEPPIEASRLRELSVGVRAIAAFHSGQESFDITVTRDASGKTLFDDLAHALDELELRRERG